MPRDLGRVSASVGAGGTLGGTQAGCRCWGAVLWVGGGREVGADRSQRPPKGRGREPRTPCGRKVASGSASPRPLPMHTQARPILGSGAGYGVCVLGHLLPSLPGHRGQRWAVCLWQARVVGSVVLGILEI